MAIGLGMIAAVELARPEGLGRAAFDLEEHCVELLSDLAPVKSAIDRFDRELFERAILTDKKHSRTELHLIVPKTEGGVAEIGLPRSDDTLARLTRALERAWELVR